MHISEPAIPFRQSSQKKQEDHGTLKTNGKHDFLNLTTGWVETFLKPR